MTDETYKKQLEAFGIEQARFVKGDPAKKRQEERQEATIAVVRALMERIEGRQWLYAQLDICGVFTVPFVPGQPDVSNLLAGAQAYGHTLLRDIMLAAPENFYVMVQEEAARKAALIANAE